ncbi:MAG: type II toxin-antitoxin system RelE/ParE family toxin [Nanoarchaeota archaeon]
MYSIKFSDKALRFFEKLDKNIQDRIGSVLERIKIRPQDFIEKLVGEQGYKLRAGDYRLFSDIIENQLLIFIIEINHRKNAYKK